MSSKRNHSIDLPYDFFTQNIFSLNLSVFAPLREDSFDLSFFYLSAFAPLREDLFDLSFFYLSAFAPLRETIYLIFHFPTAFAGSETALVAKYFSTRLFMLSSFSGTIPMTTESSGK